RAQEAFVLGGAVTREAQRRVQIAAQFGQHFGPHAFATGDFRCVFAPAHERGAVAAGEAEARTRRPRLWTRRAHGRRSGRAALGATSSGGLARKSCTSGSIGCSARGVIVSVFSRISSCSVRI